MAITSAKQRRLFLKRGLTFFLAIALILNINVIQAFAAGAEPTEPGTYTVPIESLVSKAPLPAVQSAFANAFGTTAEVTVDEDGSKIVTIRAQHMIINFGGEYHANVKTIEGATYHSYQTALYSPTFGAPAVTEEVEVPNEISFPLPEANEAGGYVIMLTVDFMDAFLGGGNPYPTGVTLTLDFVNAVAHTTELSSLIASYQELKEENYTSDTWSALRNLLDEAEEMVTNGASMADINAMMAQLKAAKDNLEWRGGDYSKVESALAQIPADSSLYTEESWNALMTAKDAVQHGLTIDRQEEIDAWADEIEEKAAALVYREGNYEKVDQAVASVPKDLSKYTAASVNTLQNALDGVIRDLKINEQVRIDKMASDITTAVKGLTEKDKADDKKNDDADDTKNDDSDESLDKDNLADGIYKVSVQLWHATNDNPSMAASSFKDNARIIVRNGVYTMYVYTQSMTFGSITASLQELKIADLNENYTMAKVENEDTSGNPTSFSFVLPHTQEYIKVKVNPYVEMMGNQDLDARIRVDYTSLEKESDNPDDPSVDITDTTDTKSKTNTTSTTNTSKKSGTTSGTTTTPKTGDSSDVLLYSLLAFASAGIILLIVVNRKRRENSYE